MSAIATPWRPLGEADLDWARANVGAVLERWQDEWFDRRLFKVTAVEALAADFRLGGEGRAARWRAGDRLGVESDAAAWNRYALAAMALTPHADAQVPDALLAPFQHELIESLLTRLGADLLRTADAPTLARSLPDDVLALRHGGVRLTVGSARDPQLLDLYCAAELFWSRPLATAPARGDSAKPESVATALADSRVRVSAILGSCDLTALQFTELAIGDVLTTSQLLHEPIELRLDADNAPSRTIAHGHPGRSRQHLSVALTALSHSESNEQPARRQ